MKHSELIKAIAKLTGDKPKQKDIAQVIRKPVSTINSRASRDLRYTYEEIKKIQDYYRVDLMNNEQIVNDLLGKRLDYLEQQGIVDIDYYPNVFGSCGGGRFILSEIKERMQVPRSIIEDYRKFKKYSVINAIGDSMTPYIQDRDLLIVEHYNNEQIRDNRVYVFRFGDSIFVKRLVFNIDELIVKSDNKEYKEKIIEKDDLNEVQIIGQIVGLMRGMR